jgi:hypothetical protein
VLVVSTKEDGGSKQPLETLGNTPKVDFILG